MLKDLFKVKQFKTEIKNLKKQNEENKTKYLNDLDECYKKINMLESEIQKYSSNNRILPIMDINDIDVDTFVTNVYKNSYVSFINDGTHSDDAILNKFNELIDKEKVFFEGVVSCIDFIRNKRNKKLSTEKQLIKYMLTESGKQNLEKYL